ncbi:MAG: choice-of-anchor tandem repeat NxxGxxAF-containing protein [Gammaproteobacteria bacterium]
MFKKYIFAAILLATAQSSADVRVLVLDGEAAPNGQGNYVGSGGASVAMQGKYVAIATSLQGPTGMDDPQILLISDCSDTVSVVAFEADFLPNSNRINVLRGLGGPILNSSGLIATPAQTYLASNPNAARTDMFSGSRAGILGMVAPSGGSVPDGNGQFSVSSFIAPAINEFGLIAFSGSLFNTSGGANDDEGVFVYDANTGTRTEIVRKGDSVPLGPGTYTGTQSQASEVFSSPYISRDGRVAFYADVDGSVFRDTGIFVSDGTTTIDYFRYRDPLPSTTFEYGTGGSYDFNENGDLAVVVNYAFTSTTVDAIFRSNGSEVVRIAANGAAAPGGGIYFRVNSGIKQDASGRVLFTSSSTLTEEGLFLGDGTSTTLIAAVGQPAPNNRGDFTDIGNFTISSSGIVAFNARIGEERAVYRYINDELEELISTDTVIDGSQVTGVNVAGSRFAQIVGVNNDGEVAVRFFLQGGRGGVAVVGEPLSQTADTDGDSVPDSCDNCTLAQNVSQLDTNNDGFGNVCDADLNNDNIVNFIDISLFSRRFLTNDADADLNGDGTVNFLDYVIMGNSFLSPPGPAATSSR